MRLRVECAQLVTIALRVALLRQSAQVESMRPEKALMLVKSALKATIATVPSLHLTWNPIQTHGWAQPNQLSAPQMDYSDTAQQAQLCQ